MDTRRGARREPLSHLGAPALASGASGQGWLTGRWGGVEFGPRKDSRAGMERGGIGGVAISGDGPGPGRQVRRVRTGCPDAKPLQMGMA
jgi:hypothetical protein